MFLGHDEILERIRTQNLIEGYLPEAVQGAGVDLRIHRLYELRGGGFIGREERRLPEVVEQSFTLKPGQYYLLSTMERVNMPEDLVAFMFNRSSLFRCGASLRTAVIDPGYHGELTVGIKNEGTEEIHLEEGARVLQLVFALVKGGTRRYEGRYQGGRVV
ncbi:MAG: dCTP deaminase [Methanobacteriota archaeon]|nr:MAG: dCTP deaminase [Euryarchaeota archaeon]